MPLPLHVPAVGIWNRTSLDGNFRAPASCNVIGRTPIVCAFVGLAIKWAVER